MSPSIPKPSSEDTARFLSLFERRPEVQIRPMFGKLRPAATLALSVAVPAHAQLAWRFRLSFGGPATVGIDKQLLRTYRVSVKRGSARIA